MKANTGRQGFGMVELILAMLASSILALIIGSLLFFAWSGWVRNRGVVAMQRDASLAMRVMAREIRQSRYGQITVDGSSLGCVDRDDQQIDFLRSGGTLEMEIDGNPHLHLVEGSLLTFSPRKIASDRSIGIVMVLSDGHETVRNAVIVFPRN